MPSMIPSGSPARTDRDVQPALRTSEPEKSRRSATLSPADAGKDMGKPIPTPEFKSAPAAGGSEVQAEKDREAPPQKLIQPLTHLLAGFGFKSRRYYETGVVTLAGGSHMQHFGADWWQQKGTSRALRSPGMGKVLLAGPGDSTFGNLLVLRYNRCVNHQTGEIRDLILRCYHLASIAVKTGQEIRTGEVLGVIGSTGRYSSGIHLHIETDTAVQDPYGVPGIAGTQYLHWVTVRSKTIRDPAEWIHTGKGQTADSAGDYYRDAGRDSDYRFAKE